MGLRAFTGRKRKIRMAQERFERADHLGVRGVNVCPAERGAAPGVVHVPMREVPGRVGELPRERDVVVVCHHGVRSLQVARYLVRLGFDTVWNLTGGMAAWADQVDPAMSRY